MLYLNCELRIANAERLAHYSQLFHSQLTIIPFATPNVRNSQLLHSQLQWFATRNYSTRNSKSSQLATRNSKSWKFAINPSTTILRVYKRLFLALVVLIILVRSFISSSQFLISFSELASSK